MSACNNIIYSIRGKSLTLARKVCKVTHVYTSVVCQVTLQKLHAKSLQTLDPCQKNIFFISKLTRIYYYIRSAATCRIMFNFIELYQKYQKKKTIPHVHCPYVDLSFAIYCSSQRSLVSHRTSVHFTVNSHHFIPIYVCGVIRGSPYISTFQPFSAS